MSNKDKTEETLTGPGTKPAPILEHAYLTVRNIDETTRFYGALFPTWAIRWQGKTREGLRWVHFGDPRGVPASYLSLAEAPHAPAGDTPYTTRRIQHLGFSMRGVAETIERAAAVGISPTDHGDWDGYRRAYFVDPNGHEIELVEKLM